MILLEAAKQALEFVEHCWRDVTLNDYSSDLREKAECALREAIEQTEKPCTWTYDDYEQSWNGTCGVCWAFMEGSPKENGVNFCPKCGKPIEVAQEPTDWSAA